MTGRARRAAVERAEVERAEVERAVPTEEITRAILGGGALAVEGGAGR